MPSPKGQTIFFQEELEPVYGEVSGNGLVCEESGVLHLVHHKDGSPIDVNLSIGADFLEGDLRVGSCEDQIPQTSKDFWHGQIHTKNFDLLVEVGVNIHAHGFIHLIPTRINPKCWRDSRFGKMDLRWGLRSG